MRMALRAAGAFCFVAGSAAGQSSGSPPPPQLTLAEARALAQRTSPDIAAARQAMAAAAGRARQAGAFPNPTLSYGREETSRTGETNWQNIVTLNQPLEIGGQRGARRDAADHQRVAAEARLAATTARIDYDVVRSYAMVVAKVRRATLAFEAADAFSKAQRISAVRLAGGDVSGYENRRLRLEAARYATLRLEALVARDSALRVLGSLTGLSDSLEPGGFELPDTLTPAPLAVSVDSLVARALAHRPELLAAVSEAEAGATQARLARAERIPTPLLSGGFKNEQLASGERLNGFVAGVSFALPLWDRRAGAVAAARSDSARSIADVEVVRRQTLQEVRIAYQAHQTMASQLDTLRAQLGDEAAKARQAAQAAYAEGEISLLEWLDSVRAYHEAESAYATLWAEYIARRAALERATGATLF